MHKSKKIVLKASIVKNLPVSATKPSRDPATPSAIFFLLSSATVSSVTVAAVECPPANKSTKTKQNCLDSGAVATQVPLGCSNSGSTF